jgi:hypothetical protein
MLELDTCRYYLERQELFAFRFNFKNDTIRKGTRFFGPLEFGNHDDFMHRLIDTVPQTMHEVVVVAKFERPKEPSPFANGVIFEIEPEGEELLTFKVVSAGIQFEHGLVIMTFVPGPFICS